MEYFWLIIQYVQKVELFVGFFFSPIRHGCIPVSLRSSTYYWTVCCKPIACTIKRAVSQRGDGEGTFNICSHQAQLAQLLNVNQSKQIIFLTPGINHRTSLPISHRWLIRRSARLPLITQQMRRSLETRLIVLFSYDLPLSTACIIHHYSSTSRGISMGSPRRSDVFICSMWNQDRSFLIN